MLISIRETRITGKYWNKILYYVPWDSEKLWYGHHICHSEKVQLNKWVIYKNVKFTPSSLPWSKWNAPALCIPGRNHTGCVVISRSTSPISQAAPYPVSRLSTEELSSESPAEPPLCDDRDSRLWKIRHSQIFKR